MGSIGAPEVLVVLLVALIVLGPQKLPEFARQAGRALAEFRRVTSGFQDELRDAFMDSTEAESRPAEIEANGHAPSPSSNGWRRVGPPTPPPPAQ